MKKIAFHLCIALCLAAATLLSSCQQASPGQVAVSIKAGIGSAAAKSAASRSLSGGETVAPISAYRVVFKKIEIGNTETDKFTLWENSAGMVENIASPVSLAGVQAIEPGTYNYVRLTIGDTLSVDGSVTDPADATVYSGTGSCVLDNTEYLWGTNIANSKGELTLRGPITITANSSLSFSFDIAGTVTYKSGPAQNAALGVTKPVLSLSSD